MSLRSVLPLTTVLLAASLAAAQEGSFQRLFDGQTLDGWEGDARFWRVEDGAIVGETTDQEKAPHNTFLIYRPEKFADFELRLKYQVKGYNSGVQYRSVEEDDYVVRGYQADFEDRWHEGTADRFSGMFFEEKGRMFMGQRGDVVIVRHNPENPQKPKIEKIASTGKPAELEKVIKRDDWNELIVIAKANQFMHIINGRLMAVGIDEDAPNRRGDGILAFQLHSGPPMKIQVKDIRIRKLD